jgi:UDP-N-acetylglucosamine/UDP-N-acetylgalactosamine diphosphorylase
LGGTGGLVGPAEVGYGAVAGAGQVVRNGIGAGRLLLQVHRAVDREIDVHRLDPILPRAQRNIRYIGQLFALQAWYRQVRLPTTPAARRPVIEAALQVLDMCIQERRKQLERFVTERGGTMAPIAAPEKQDCPLPFEGVHEDHVLWVQSLPEDQVEAGARWLQGIVDAVAEPTLAHFSQTQGA